MKQAWKVAYLPHVGIHSSMGKEGCSLVDSRKLTGVPEAAPYTPYRVYSTLFSVDREDPGKLESLC
jgi:hypothetical protein